MNLKKKFLRDYYDYAKYKLFPICRSLTGDGNKKTLNLIKKKIKFLKIKSFQSGSKVYDWRIPPEWNIKSASIKDKFGKKLVDFSDNNLHLVGYSIPIKKKVNKDGAYCEFEISTCAGVINIKKDRKKISV